MPYKDLSDLPDSIRNNLPKHAQEIYHAAYNSAWDEYNDPDEAGRRLARGGLALRGVVNGGAEVRKRRLGTVARKVAFYTL